MGLRITLLVILFSILACDDKPSAPEIDPNAPTFSIVDACLDTATRYGIIPLSVGNRWLYEFSQFSDAGQLDSSGPDMLVEVAGTISYRGVSWFRLRTTYGGQSSDNYSDRFARNCPMGYCENGKLMFKDITPGKTYIYQGMTVTLSDSIYRGSTPAGDYRCRRLEMYDPSTSLNWHFYIQSGIGRMKTEVVKMNPERVYRRWSLKSYKVN